ncbi:MAG: hypothetical protein IT215_02300 [Chitinophagaceae bacterium]|nr:hypothetical protein [Chitinophagaceae bacterium]
MRTITISIPGSATTEVLKAIIQNNLKHQFIGTDHNFNLLISIQYKEKEEELIQTIIKGMNAIEAICEEIGKVFDEAIIKFQKETEELFPKRTFKSFKDLYKKDEHLKEA